MSGELESLLKMVAEGRISAEEAAPIVAALEEKARLEQEAAAASSSRETSRRQGPAQSLLTDRRLRVFVAENGRQIINIQIPLAAAGFAIDSVPGLSPDNRSRIVEAIQQGLTGPIVDVSDHGDEVRITIE